MEVLYPTLIENNVSQKSNSSFIEANTNKVTLQHLKDDCIIPVFSKDNESTISHFQFISKTLETVKQMFPDLQLGEPEIRVSHTVKGRIPSAVGKPAKELLEHEKTIYYERCAFIINIPQSEEIVNSNSLSLSIGGVRAYNQENLYARKSLEKFKMFIGFKNKVCTNLCISTDGFSNEIRIGSIQDLEEQVYLLSTQWNKEKQLETMEMMSAYKLSEKEFAHLIGKVRMYQYLAKEEKKDLIPFSLNDRQVNQVVRDYYLDDSFKRTSGGELSLWNFYNLLTGANKSSYIDNNLERNVKAYEFVEDLCYSIESKTPNWYLNIID